MHRKQLVSWDRPFVIEEGRVRDPVKRLVLIEDRDRSVSVIRTVPLAVKETYDAGLACDCRETSAGKDRFPEVIAV